MCIRDRDKYEYLGNAIDSQTKKVTILEEQLKELENAENRDEQAIEKKRIALTQAQTSLERYKNQSDEVANSIKAGTANIEDFADKLIAEADVICCLDFNALKRIDDMADAVAASPARKIMIDHHLYPEDFCKIVMSYPKISSTSELIFRLICRMGYFSDISKEGAECIYTGMMTDTGGFTYNSNNREIYFIISELLSKGIDKDDIYRKVYNTNSESRLRLMGYVLSNMTVYSESNSALITLTKAEQSKFNYIKGDSEGFVNIPLSIKNVCFSCFLREDTEKPMIKISLRSVGTFPCNQLAAEFFHGGGHLNASGGEFFGTMEEAKAVFEKALEKYKPLLTAKS